MATFRLRTIPGSAWPPLLDPRVNQVWTAYLELGRTQWLDAGKLEAAQLMQARKLIAHAIAHVPYYREVLGAAGIAADAIRTMADFRRIPKLARRAYQAETDRFVADQLPSGTVATRTMMTSGSSGAPTTVHQTNVVDLWWHAFYLRDLEWCDVDTTGKLAAIRSSGAKPGEIGPLLAGTSAACWRPQLELLFETGRLHAMDISVDPRKQLAWLREVQPDYVLSYPANLEALAALVAASSRIPSVRGLRAISDTLADETRAAIEAAFGVPVTNTYSCCEAGYLASPCPAGHGLHVHAENVIFEVLDDAGNPCAPGDTGHVYLTTLANFRAPFIRYDVGDEVTLGPARCPCGRGLPLLARVQGKRTPMFRLSGGRLRGGARLAYLVRKVGGHLQHQVIQRGADHVVVRIVADATWTAAHAELMRQRVCEFFEAPMRVEIETYPRMPMPAHGKFQNMVVEYAG